jgi:[CysO sulfur-carrier protein]-S-L-cysteine hydrolase
MTSIPDGVLREIAAHARSTYPAECCGVVLADRDERLRFVPIANIAGTDHPAAESSDRKATDGYVMDPTAFFRAYSIAEAEGGGLRILVHSHPDVGAYFSTEDKGKALTPDRQPWWPGVDYLVVSCRAGQVDDAKLYSWDEKRSDFDETQVPITSAFR